MSTFARIDEGKVAELVELPEGFGIHDAFHPEIAALFHACPDGVEVGWTFSDGVYSETVPDPVPLDDLKAQKIAALTLSCAAAILGGYRSTALGAEHTYPSGVTDQINMMGSVTASLLPALPSDWATPFWCEDGQGIWDFRMHSASQIQAAGADGKSHVVTCQSMLAELSATVLMASTGEEIDPIDWPSA